MDKVIPATAQDNPGLFKKLDEARDHTEKSLIEWRKESDALKQRGHKVDQFDLDPWQEEALEALISRANVVVDAPTTAGKTRIIETFFARNIHDPSFRACYTCPVKSLSNDKVKEFRALFGEHLVGIATGDNKENLDAPIVVATLETYRNSLLGTEPDLGRSIAIFDEYHYLQDDSRGSAWEEAMILTPPSCQILLLSASIDNPMDFAKWLESLSGRPSRLIHVEKRPVPLVNMVWCEDRWLLSSTLPKSVLEKKKFETLHVLSPRVLATRVVSLVDLELTPCIIYAGKRAACEEIIRELVRIIPPLPQEAALEVKKNLETTNKTYPCFSMMDGKLRQYIEKYGIAFHHSGLTPPVRIAVENLLKDGLLRFCSATMGLSLGINFSVRSALMSDSERPGEKGMTPYSPSEILQMKGRAGRRGKDAVGFSLWPEIKPFRKWAQARRNSCYSNLKADPITFLGLLGRGFSLGQIEQFYKKSFLKLTNPSILMSLPSHEKIEKRIDRTIPCTSPVHELMAYQAKKRSLCKECLYRQTCHPFIHSQHSSQLMKILFHLHKINAIDDKDHLTTYGETAKHFPQNGGLLIAWFLDRKVITDRNLMTAIQLMAGLSLPRHKAPNVPEDYNFPYNQEEIETLLEDFYPIELFPDSYDPPWGKRRFPVLKDFNPAAGFIIKEWSLGTSWDELSGMVTHEQFGEGDLIHLIYRVISFLQALSRVPDEMIAQTALELRTILLREPVNFLL